MYLHFSGYKSNIAPVMHESSLLFPRSVDYLETATNSIFHSTDLLVGVAKSMGHAFKPNDDRQSIISDYVDVSIT